MDKTCKMCGYVNQYNTDQCPQCKNNYDRAEIFVQQQEEEQAREAKELKLKQTATQNKKEQRFLKNKSVCTNCGHIGFSVLVTNGSIFIEIILWFCFIAPGLIYSIWRHTSRYKACAVCKKACIIPASSPRGKKLIAENN